MKLPSMTMFDTSTWIPALLPRLITSPRTVLPWLVPVKRNIPKPNDGVRLTPSSSMSRTAFVPSVGPFVFALVPGCV